MTWRTIDSAPKDGVLIKLTRMSGGAPGPVWMMRWDHLPNADGTVGMWFANDTMTSWDRESPQGPPTHWKPDE